METQTHVLTESGRRVVRRVTGADDREREIESISSWHAGMQTIARYGGMTRQKGREMIEEHFWLGGAIAKAESYSTWGSGFFRKLYEDCGISPAVARRAMRLWDLFAGDVIELHDWCTRFLEENGNLLMSDVTHLVEANRQITDGRQFLRSVRADLDEENVSERIVIESGLEKSIRAREKSIREMKMKTPRQVGRAPTAEQKARKIRTLKSARQMLAFEPDAAVPIEEIELADGITYEVIVSLQPKDQ